MVYKLLDYQERNLKELKSAINQYKHISIVGVPNSGRTTVTQYLDKEKYIIITVVPVVQTDEKCSAIRTALTKIDKLNKKLFNINCNVSLSLGIFDISLNKENLNFDNIEKFLIKWLKTLSRNNNVIVVIKNPSQIDFGTQRVLDFFFKSKRYWIFKKKLVKIEICDKGEPISGEKVSFENFSKDKYKENYLYVLQTLGLNPNIELSQTVLEFIFNNGNENIGLFAKVVKDLNENNIDNELLTLKKSESLIELIDTGISLSEYEKELKSIFTILALCDRYFTSLDLSYLLNKNQNIVELYLKYGISHNFINNNDNGYQIMFEVIKKIFSNVSKEKQIETYNQVIKLINTYYPDAYNEKYKFSKLAAQNKASTYLLQDIMKQIRLKGNYNHIKCTNVLSETEQNIIDMYYDAYAKANNNMYEDAIDILRNALGDMELWIPIKQEFNLLLSQCLIKSIEEKYRKEAINLLNYDENNDEIDEYLKYRLDARKISANIHNGNYIDAKTQCDKTENRLSKNVENTKSPGCEYLLNTLYRKYCSINPYESSIYSVNKSVKFFLQHKQYIKEAYIALNNALALNLINGNENAAVDNITQLKKIKEKNFNIRFPRPELLENNLLIFKMLYNRCGHKQEIIERFYLLYNSTKNLADNIFIASNYAICLAIFSELNKALEILEKEYKKLKNTNDLEGIYSYRIFSNYAICKFINDNNQKAEALNILSKVSLPKNDIHNTDRNEELSLIKSTMEKSNVCTSAIEWMNLYKQGISTAKNYYCLYQQGFVFTTLFDWDDE